VPIRLCLRIFRTFEPSLRRYRGVAWKLFPPLETDRSRSERSLRKIARRLTYTCCTSACIRLIIQSKSAKQVCEMREETKSLKSLKTHRYTPLLGKICILTFLTFLLFTRYGSSFANFRQESEVVEGAMTAIFSRKHRLFGLGVVGFVP